MVVVMALGMSMSAFAASSDTWSVVYTAGAPQASANPVDYLYVTYTADGFSATAYKLTGSGDRMVTISSSSAGGMTAKTVTTTSNPVTWKMKGSTTGNVTFKVVASASVNCTSTGIIKQR